MVNFLTAISMTDSTEKINYPELFFGFVAPIGADTEPSINVFRKYLTSRGYRVIDIKVTEIFNTLQKTIVPKKRLSKKTELERYETFISYGNQLRAVLGDDILAALAIKRIIASRIKHSPPGSFEKIAFLIRQFKRKEEIDLLRIVYGRLFFQVSIYSRRGARVEHLSKKFASNNNKPSAQRYRDAAEALIGRDENEVEERHGQRVASIFHDADFIVNTDASETIDRQIFRFCELIFGSNSVSPTKAEYGLFVAKAAALRSLDLSRQVGAAIFSKAGEVISLGSNEVPKAGGGTYWSDEKFDDRDFVRRKDSNDQRKKEIFGEIARLIDTDANPTKLLRKPKIRDSQLMDALEYGRVVHAEMSALTDAARCGHAVKEATIYCTTFPCHMCAKHIIAAGITKVVFLEPYPKSLAFDLHSDSIQVEGGDRGHYHVFPAVEFEHFYGVSPRRYKEIFERAKRKNDQGIFVEYRDGSPRPIMDLRFPFYSQLESHFTTKAVRAVNRRRKLSKQKKTRKKKKRG